MRVDRDAGYEGAVDRRQPALLVEVGPQHCGEDRHSTIELPVGDMGPPMGVLPLGHQLELLRRIGQAKDPTVAVEEGSGLLRRPSLRRQPEVELSGLETDEAGRPGGALEADLGGATAVVDEPLDPVGVESAGGGGGPVAHGRADEETEQDACR